MNDKVKSLFFSQYLGQKLLMVRDYPCRILYGVTGNEYLAADMFTGPLSFDLHRYDANDTGYLLLRDISQLNGDELYIIAIVLHQHSQISENQTREKMISDAGNYVKWLTNGKDLTTSAITANKVYQLLRGLGALTSFAYLSETNQPITLTPAEIINLGWAKLQSNEQ